MDVDINTLRGLSTVVMLIAFITLVFWAYSGRRKKGFEEAAQLPFADEQAHRQTVRSDSTTGTAGGRGSAKEPDNKSADGVNGVNGVNDRRKG